MEVGKCGAEEIAESYILIHKKNGRGRKRERERLRLAWTFEPTKLTLSDSLTLTRSQTHTLTTLHIYEPMGAIIIQNTTDIQE